MPPRSILALRRRGLFFPFRGVDLDAVLFTVRLGERFCERLGELLGKLLGELFCKPEKSRLGLGLRLREGMLFCLL